MISKIFHVLMSFLLIGTGIPAVRSAEAQEKKEFNIAVLDLDANGIASAEAKSLSNSLRAQIMQVISSREFIRKTPIRYAVVERSNMDKIFDEYKVQNTGCTDVSCAVELGKMLNAERIVIGSVGLVGTTYTINISMVDIETAKVLKAANYRFQGASDNLLNRGIPDVVDQLMLDKRKTSRKKLYLTGGAVVTAGIIGLVLSSSTKEPSPGPSGTQTGTVAFTLPDPAK